MDELVLDEWRAWGSPGPRVAVIDAPALAHAALDAGLEVVGFCDDLRLQDQLPHEVRVADSGEQFGPLDVAWLRLPTSLDALDEYAGWCAASGADLLAGGRIKHLNRSMNDVLARHYTQISASLGRRGARVLRGQGPRAAGAGLRRWPRTTAQPVWGVTLSHHGAAFAGGSVDAGTRLLLQHLSELPQNASQVVDLGCGNGVISVLLARRYPDAGVHAIDVSLAATRSTDESARLNDVEVSVERANGLTHLPDESVDLIATNPPFHVGTARESTPTMSMLSDAARVLRPGGEVWCVFNSHLPWLALLREQVGPAAVIEQNRRYTLVRASRTR